MFRRIQKLRDLGPRVSSRLKSRAGGLLPLACLFVGLGGAPRGALSAALPDGYLDQRILEGLDAPTSFAFLPDGRVLIAERAGRVRLLSASFTDTATVLTESDVRTTGEGGFGAIAVDPAWPARPYLYAFTTRATAPAIALLRYRATGALDDPAALGLSFSGRTLLLGDLPDSSAAHNGSDLEFGPDGTLFVSLGEDGVRCAAQDSTALRGAILRLNVRDLPDAPPGDTLTDWRALVPPDNPWAADSARSALVFCHGLRNPFRFHVDANSGALLIGDVGGSLFEEIDEAHGGENFGWPLWEGDSARADLCGLPTRPGRVPPVFSYPHAGVFGLVAVTGGPVYRRQGGPLQFEPACEGSLFLADIYAGDLRRLAPRPGGGWSVADSLPGQPDAARWATGLPGITQMRVGPDGGLYLTRLFDGDFRRIIKATASGVAVDEAPPDALRALPNPARRGAPVRLSWAAAPSPAERVTLFDVVGRRRLERRLPGGAAEFTWDGRDDAGQRVATGVYFVRVAGAGWSRRVRLLILG